MAVLTLNFDFDLKLFLTFVILNKLICTKFHENRAYTFEISQRTETNEGKNPTNKLV